MSVAINTSSDNNRFTSLDDSRKSQKEKNILIHLVMYSTALPNIFNSNPSFISPYTAKL
jgi:hypothetical protein